MSADPDSVWLLGTHMTKFGKYPDKEAAQKVAKLLRAVADQLDA